MKESQNLPGRVKQYKQNNFSKNELKFFLDVQGQPTTGRKVNKTILK